MNKINRQLIDKAKKMYLKKVPNYDICMELNISISSLYKIIDSEFNYDVYKFKNKPEIKVNDSYGIIVRDCINDTYKMSKEDWEYLAYEPRGGIGLIDKYVTRIKDIESKHIKEKNEWKRATLIILGLYLLVVLLSVL